MDRYGYSGGSYDRYVERNEQSTIHQMKKTFWKTKQVMISKLGKKEDEHVVASDQELDSKIEVFRAIQHSSMDLLRVIEKYQDRLCALSQEENATGRFLKSQSGQDKTRAGKMMAAVGKSLSFSSQQRLALRVPLVRLYQEVETFRYRAISDTLLTINRMEAARTDYRGALLWMKNVSEELDPDTFKQLENFRKVQAQVKGTKAKFDKLKLDTMQKIDLLAASRCNMFSHVLATYQTTLLQFWEKTSRTMSAVLESFKGYQHYEFTMIKELAEPSRKLAEETGGTKDLAGSSFEDSDEELISSSTESNKETKKNEKKIPDTKPKERLISFGEGVEENGNEKDKNGSLENLFGEYHDEPDKPEEDAKPLTLSREPAAAQDKKSKQAQGNKDLLGGEEPDEELDKDDMTLLNEILNAPDGGDDDFAHDWAEMFGSGQSTSGGATGMEHPKEESSDTAQFMPSFLLDMTAGMGSMNLSQGGNQEQAGMMGMMPGLPGMMMGQQQFQQQPQIPPPGPGAAGPRPKGPLPKKLTEGQSIKKPTNQMSQQTPQQQSAAGQRDMSAWFNLFAELDPLANPDAVGKQEGQILDA